MALKKGDPAPFSGQLFETNTAIRWGNWLEQYKFHLDADLSLQEKKSTIDLRLCEKTAGLQHEADQKTIEALKTRLTEMEKKLELPRWYESGSFLFAMGAVSMAGVVALTAYSISVAK